MELRKKITLVFGEIFVKYSKYLLFFYSLFIPWVQSDVIWDGTNKYSLLLLLLKLIKKELWKKHHLCLAKYSKYSKFTFIGF